jgi:Histidinol dehydrogenase
VADASADPAVIALDLIAQAEHDPEARCFFVSTDAALIDQVTTSLGTAIASAGRREIVDAAMHHTKTVLVRDLAQAADVVNDLAAEHLQLVLTDPGTFLKDVRNAGAIFIGPATAVPFGDYGVASNHVLPTAGTSRFSSGLRASDYVTVSSVVQMNEEAARRYAPGTTTIANAEGLVGHARAMDARTKDDPT